MNNITFFNVGTNYARTNSLQYEKNIRCLQVDLFRPEHCKLAENIGKIIFLKSALLYNEYKNFSSEEDYNESVKDHILPIAGGKLEIVFPASS